MYTGRLLIPSTRRQSESLAKKAKNSLTTHWVKALEESVFVRNKGQRPDDGMTLRSTDLKIQKIAQKPFSRQNFSVYLDQK